MKHKLTFRSEKGASLTIAELDANFAFLRDENEALKRRLARLEDMFATIKAKPA